MISALTTMLVAGPAVVASPASADGLQHGHGASHHARCATRHTAPSRSRRASRHARTSCSAPATRRSRATTRPAARPHPQRHEVVVASAIVVTPCQNTELVPEPANLPLVRAAVLCLINAARAEHREPPLALDEHLQRAADEHSSELVAQDYFAHVSPSGETPVDRARADGYIRGPNVGYVIGENLAWGTLTLSTPHAIVDAWLASPEHLANILESRYTGTGIGVVAGVPPSLGEGQPGATYAQEFGVIVE